MADIIQHRRGTAALATSNNPILADGEFGIETDTKKIKFGDGVTAWNSLPYLSVTADVAAAIIAASAKTTPVDADQFAITDSASGNVLKKLTWANIKSTLKTYFDTLYSPIGAGGGLAVVPFFTAWYTTPVWTTSSKALNDGQQFYVPFTHMMYAVNNMSMTAIAFRTSASGISSLLRVGIYERTTLNNLVLVRDFGNVSSDVIGTITFTFGTAQTLTKGKLYYLVFKKDNTGGTSATFQSYQQTAIETQFAVAPAPADMWQTNQALYKTGIGTGAFPSTDTLPTVSSNETPPRFQFQLTTI